MVEIFNIVLYKPLYNGLIYFITIVPGENLGLAIILLTIAVKMLLLPLSHRQSTSQVKMKQIEPEMQKIREANKSDKQEQARKTMELYKKHGINPFSGCFLLLLQIPLLIALYRVFFKGLADGVSVALLYPFISAPETLHTMFLGVDLLGKNVIFALIAAVLQYYQITLAMPGAPQKKEEDTKKEKGGELNFREEFTKNMSTQMRYVMPVIVFFFAYSISAAIALYWAVTNLFSIVHELIVKERAKKMLLIHNQP
jgi:YidC/Oxa1 family membrane protein insertase